MLPVYQDERANNGCCRVYLCITDEIRVKIIQELSSLGVSQDAWETAEFLVEENKEFCWLTETFDTSGMKDFDYDQDCCGIIISRWEKSNPFISSWFEGEAIETYDEIDTQYSNVEDAFENEFSYDMPKTIVELKEQVRNIIHPFNLQSKK